MLWGTVPPSPVLHGFPQIAGRVLVSARPSPGRGCGPHGLCPLPGYCSFISYLIPQLLAFCVVTRTYLFLFLYFLI